MSKSRVGRWIVRVVLGLVILVIVLLVGLVLFLGPVIKTAAEKVGPKVLGVPVTVENVDVNLFTGSFNLKNLRVGNPQGYSSDPLLSLGSLVISIDMGSLMGTNAIVVHEVALNDLHASYEVVKGVANVQAIKAKVAPEDQEKKPVVAETKPAQPAKPARKVVIEKLASHGGMVSVRTGLTLGQAVTVPLPPIEAMDIGRKTGGITVTEVVGNIFLEITKSVGTAVVDTLKNIVPNAASLTKGGEALGGAAQGAAQGAKDAAKGVKDTFKRLF